MNILLAAPLAHPGLLALSGANILSLFFFLCGAASLLLGLRLIPSET
jgi:hypothetical protein